MTTQRDATWRALARLLYLLGLVLGVAVMIELDYGPLAIGLLVMLAGAGGFDWLRGCRR